MHRGELERQVAVRLDARRGQRKRPSGGEPRRSGHGRVQAQLVDAGGQRRGEGPVGLGAQIAAVRSGEAGSHALDRRAAGRRDRPGQLDARQAVRTHLERGVARDRRDLELRRRIGVAREDLRRRRRAGEDLEADGPVASRHGGARSGARRGGRRDAGRHVRRGDRKGQARDPSPGQRAVVLVAHVERERVDGGKVDVERSVVLDAGRLQRQRPLRGQIRSGAASGDGHLVGAWRERRLVGPVRGGRLRRPLRSLERHRGSRQLAARGGSHGAREVSARRPVGANDERRVGGDRGDLEERPRIVGTCRDLGGGRRAGEDGERHATRGVRSDAREAGRGRLDGRHAGGEAPAGRRAAAARRPARPRAARRPS